MNPQQQNRNPQYKDKKEQPAVQASRNPNQSNPGDTKRTSPRPQDDDMDERNDKSQKDRDEDEKSWKSPGR